MRAAVTLLRRVAKKERERRWALSPKSPMFGSFLVRAATSG